MFAVIDVETTGLRPARDRVVEVAVVRLDDAHNVVEEWTTLVDPGCQVRGSRVHGIYTRHVQGAPTFGEIAGDLVDRLADTVVVAHNGRSPALGRRTSGSSLRCDVSYPASPRQRRRPTPIPTRCSPTPSCSIGCSRIAGSPRTRR